MTTAASVDRLPYRVLSFDGGGLHALSYLPILRDLEQHLGNSIAASDQFDLLVGTSTGSIVAMALKLGAPVDDVIAMYRVHAEAIFRKTWIWNRLFFSYRSQVLNRTLASFIRDRVGTDEDITWRQLASHSRYGSLELVVTLWDVGRESSTFLSTNLDRPQQAERLWDASLADIITTCCSAPYFFPPRQFDSHMVYCDGGITGLNNPATFGVSLVTQENRQANRPIDVISLGAGDTTVDRDVREVGDRNAVSIALGTINALMDSSAKLMDSFYAAFGPSLGIRNYLRTNHQRPPGSKLAEDEGIDGFIKNFECGRIYYSFHKTTSGGENDGRTMQQPQADDLQQWRRVWEEGFDLPVGESQPSRDQAIALSDEWSATSSSTIPSREVLPRWVPRVVVPAVLTLVISFIALAGIATYQWRRADAEAETARGAEALARFEEKRTEELARQLLENEIGAFEELPKAISSIVVPPLKDEENNEVVAFPDRRADQEEWVKLLAQIDAYSGVMDQKQAEALQGLSQELAAWIGGPQWTQVPSDVLRGQANNAALGFERLYKTAKEEFDEQTRDSDPKIQQLRKQAFDQRQRKAYQAAVDVMTQLRRADKLDQTEKVLKAYADFYVLYYGGLLMVESDEVESYMTRLGYPLSDRAEAPLPKWARTRMKPREFDDDVESTVNKYINHLKDKIKEIDSQLASSGS